MSNAPELWRWLAAALAVAALAVACDARERAVPPPGSARDTLRPVLRADTVRRVLVHPARRPSAMQRVNGPLRVRRGLASLDTPFVIRVLDQRAAPFAGATVRWTSAAPDGSRLTVIDARTDSSGESRARFVPALTADTQHVAADVADVGRIDFGVVVPVASVRLQPNALTVWSGDTVRVTATLHDSGGSMLPGGSLRWVSSDTTVLRVQSEDGVAARVVARFAGAADVVGWIGETHAAVRVVVRPETSIRFVTLDGHPVPVLELRIVSGVVLDSATISDGTYSRRVPGAGGDVEIRAREVEESRYQSVAVRVQQPRELQQLTIVLVPRRFRIDTGTYAGRDVPIDADAAMRRAGGGMFWRLVPGSGRGPRTLLGWTDDALPLHVAFDRAASDGQIYPADSAAFWSFARRMERDLGRDLFTPAEMSDSSRWPVTPVRVREQGADGHTFVSWSAAGNAYDGVVLFRSHETLRDAHVVTHELLHLLGFGHTAAWPSVARSTGGATALTPEDVAYVRLAWRLREVQQRTAARPGLPLARQ